MNPWMAVLVGASSMVIATRSCFLWAAFPDGICWAFFARLDESRDCILRSAESFYKRGKRRCSLPSLCRGSTPWARAGGQHEDARGSFCARLWRRSALILAYGGVGFLFSDFMKFITRGLPWHAHFRSVLAGCIVAYIAYRIWAYKQQRVYRMVFVPRIEVGDAGGALQFRRARTDDHRRRPQPGYYDAGAHVFTGRFV